MILGFINRVKILPFRSQWLFCSERETSCLLFCFYEFKLKIKIHSNFWSYLTELYFINIYKIQRDVTHQDVYLHQQWTKLNKTAVQSIFRKYLCLFPGIYIFTSFMIALHTTLPFHNTTYFLKRSWSGPVKDKTRINKERRRVVPIP